MTISTISTGSGSPRFVDLPVHEMFSSVSGVSLEVGGFFISALLAMYAHMEPLPLDEVTARCRVRVPDTRRYRRLVASCIETGLLVETESGLSSSLFDASFVSKQQRPRYPILDGTRAAVLAKTDGKCVYCAISLTVEPNKPNSFHADHVLTVVRGGSDDIANLVPSCAECNLKKAAKTALRFLGGGDGA